LFAVAVVAFAQTKVDPARVARLLDRAVIVDLHDDTTEMIVDEGYNLAEKHTFGQVDIPRMREGHAGGVFMSIWVDTDRYTPIESVRRALDQIDAVRRETARHPPTSTWPLQPTRFSRPGSAVTSRSSWEWKAGRQSIPILPSCVRFSLWARVT